MSVLEKFGVEIFTQHNIFERIAVDKPFRPENPAFIFIKTGSIKLRQHFNDLELSANMFMVTDPQTVYEMISVTAICAKEIKYNQKKQIFDPNANPDQWDFIFQKTSLWKYEKEYRLAIHRTKGAFVKKEDSNRDNISSSTCMEVDERVYQTNLLLNWQEYNLQTPKHIDIKFTLPDDAKIEIIAGSQMSAGDKVLLELLLEEYQNLIHFKNKKRYTESNIQIKT